MDYTRRKTLLATGATLSLAGCIDNLTTGNEPNKDDDGQNDDPDDAGHDVFQLGQSLGRPLWRYGPDTGYITLLEDENNRPWMVENPAEVEGLESWLDETDFSHSTIVYVETVGPNTCYNEIGVSNIGIEDGEIVGTVEAVDTSAKDEDCGSAETHPSAFVRVTGEEKPDDATFTVTDGRGDSSEVTADGQLVDPEFLPGGVVPPSDPAELEALTCDDEEFKRHWGPEEASRGEATDDNGNPTFAMRVHTYPATGNYDGVADEEPPVFERGDEVRVTMWNVSTEMQSTGNRHKWNLQVLTKDGWQDARVSTDGEPLEYTDEAVGHRPGEGFEWAFKMTEEGVLEGHIHEDRLEVCPDLQPGRYRFVYREAGRENLAIEFDYEG